MFNIGIRLKRSVIETQPFIRDIPPCVQRQYGLRTRYNNFFENLLPPSPFASSMYSCTKGVVPSSEARRGCLVIDPCHVHIQIAHKTRMVRIANLRVGLCRFCFSQSLGLEGRNETLSISCDAMHGKLVATQFWAFGEASEGIASTECDFYCNLAPLVSSVRGWY